MSTLPYQLARATAHNPPEGTEIARSDWGATFAGTDFWNSVPVLLVTLPGQGELPPDL